MCGRPSRSLRLPAVSMSWSAGCSTTRIRPRMSPCGRRSWTATTTWDASGPSGRSSAGSSVTAMAPSRGSAVRAGGTDSAGPGRVDRVERDRPRPPGQPGRLPGSRVHVPPAGRGGKLPLVTTPIDPRGFRPGRRRSRSTILPPCRECRTMPDCQSRSFRSMTPPTIESDILDEFPLARAIFEPRSIQAGGVKRQLSNCPIRSRGQIS